MSRKEVPRAGLVKAALAGKVTNEEGARALRLSVRQFKRLKARFRREGARGLVHRRRGQPSPRRVPAALRAQVVTLMTTTYTGFNDVHLTEKLQQVHALPVSRATVRRIRRALGRPPQRPRRAPQHRSRRPRAPAMGQLAQLDASPFAWLEDRGPTAALHGLIDDATSIPLALWFRPTEDLHGYTTVLGQTCRQYGVPVTLYGDRLSLFRRNDQYWTLAEELRGQQDPTHFGRMLRDLGMGFIAAQSPQAKGRIERLWGTLQDRLVSELRRRGLDTLAQANAFLPEFRPAFIQRFARPAVEPTPAWRPAPPDLERILSCRYTRVVARDNTVQLGARWLQIPPGPRGHSICRLSRRTARAARRPPRRALSGLAPRRAAGARALRARASERSRSRPPARAGVPARAGPATAGRGRRPHAHTARPAPHARLGGRARRPRRRALHASPSLAHDLLATPTPPERGHAGVTFSLNSSRDIFTGQRQASTSSSPGTTSAAGGPPST
jgi:transposase